MLVLLRNRCDAILPDYHVERLPKRCRCSGWRSAVDRGDLRAMRPPGLTEHGSPLADLGTATGHDSGASRRGVPLLGVPS